MSYVQFDLTVFSTLLFIEKSHHHNSGSICVLGTWQVQLTIFPGFLNPNMVHSCFHFKYLPVERQIFVLSVSQNNSTL